MYIYTEYNKYGMECNSKTMVKEKLILWQPLEYQLSRRFRLNQPLRKANACAGRLVHMQHVQGK